MPVADPYKAALRDALVRAVPRQVARTRKRAARRRVVIAFVVVLATIGSILTIALPDRRADARVDVEQRDGFVFVRLNDLESRPDEIVAALRSTGIAATVELQPVGPSNVGRFVSAVVSETSEFTVTDGRDDSFRSFSINEDFRGQVTLGLGRLAAVGERWQSPGNALAIDEPLACLEVVGLTAVDAARVLAGQPVSVSWLAVSNGVLPPGAETAEPHSGWFVIDVLSTAPDAVLVRLTETGAWPYLLERPPPIDPRCKGR
jgi:hypothetical protein